MDTFVSYSRRNKAFVQKLVEALEDNGHSVWIDWENIPLTADWMKEIESGIEAANNFIFVISPDSVRSEVCLKEVQHADANNKRFVPLLYEELVLAEDKEMLHPSISSHNWIFMRDEDNFDSAIKSLVEALETDLEYVKAHTRLLTRANEWEKRSRDASFLLRGNDLKEAQETLKESESHTPAITELQVEYINASIQAERWRKRERFLMGVITIAFLSTLVALGIAYWQFTVAERERAVAQQLSLAANSQVALTNHNRDLAIALSLAATNNTGDVVTARAETERALSEAAYDPGTRLVFSEHESPVQSAAFSQDGQLALSGAEDGNLILWEIGSGNVLQTYSGHSAAIMDVVFSPDETTTFTASADGTIRQWDIESGETLMTFQGHLGEVVALDINADGSRILTGSTDNTMRLWDTETGETLYVFRGHDGRVLDVAFHPDGNAAMSLAIDTSPILWDMESGEEIRRYDEQEPSGINLDVGALAFSPDGSRVLSSYGLNLRLWDLETGVTIREFLGHGSYVHSIAFSPDGFTAISSARRENSLRVWNINSGEEISRFEGHQGVVQDVTISPNARFALSSSQDGTVRLWELTHGALLEIYEAYDSPEDNIFSIAHAPNNDSVVAGGDNPMLVQIDMATGDVIQTYEGHRERVWTIQFSPDGDHLFSAGNERAIWMWDSNTAEVVQTFEGHEETITTIDISPDGTRMVSGSNDGTVRLWDIETNEELEVLDIEDGQLRAVQFSPDGTQVLAGANHAHLIALDTGETIAELAGHTDRINTVAFNSDGTQIATGSGDGSIRLWDAATNRTLQIFEGHTGQVRSVEFSFDDQRILSSSADATLRLWDIASGLEIRRLEGHREWINQAIFSPDGTYAISGAWDETIRRWHIHSLSGLIDWTQENRYIRELTCGERQIYLVDESQTCATLD